MSASQSPNDPLDLNKVDQQIRINELEEKLQDMGMSAAQFSPECPPDVREQYLSHIEEYESAPITCWFDELVRLGVQLPKPEALDDAALHTKLWEIIHILAKRNVFLYHTNHRSDRELYEELWKDLLREPGPVMPPGSAWQHHLDLIGSGSDEDIDISLRFYSDDASRQHWARDFPKHVMPPKETPPYDRDRLLPPPPPPPMWRSDDDEDGDESGHEGELDSNDDQEK